MFRKVFTTVVTFFDLFLGANSLEYISMNNQECRARPKMIDTNANEPVLYPYRIKVNKYSGNCNNINNVHP